LAKGKGGAVGEKSDGEQDAKEERFEWVKQEVTFLLRCDALENAEQWQEMYKLS